jgi:outer membrane lipoprotein-sorting protein
MIPVSEDNIQSRFDAILCLKPSEESTARVMKRIRQTIQNQTIKKIDIWSFLMKNKPTQLITAAAILIGIYIGFVCLGQPGIVWADVVHNVEQTKTVQFRLLVKTTDMPDAEIRVYDSSEYGSRLDLYVDGKNTVKIYSPKNNNESIMVTPDGHVLSRTTFTDDQRQQMLQRQKDPREFVKLFLAGNPKKLDKQTIDGVQTEGLEVTSPKVGGGMFENATGRIWADMKTQFPVQMEIDGISGGGTIQSHIVMDQFIWDAPLDAGEFEPNIPTAAQPVIEMKMADIDEKSLIEGLRFFAEQSGGNYPSNLAPMTVDAEFRQIHKDKGNDQPFAAEEMEKLSYLTAAGQYYQGLVEKDCALEYHGDAVTASDADRELLRWKISDDEFRVVYGDLRVDTVADKNKLLDMALALSGAKLEPDKRGPVMRILGLGEKDMIRGLGVWLELLDGRYPNSLESKAAIKQADRLLRGKFGSPDQPNKQKQELLKAKTYDIFFASAFYDKLVQEKKELVYYGDKITVEDSDRVLIRWKISKKNYRVIFGNLDSKSVTAEELAELEKQPQK